MEGYAAHMRTPPALVTPALLTWAREAAGLSVSGLAGAIGQAEERVLAWEEGIEQPSMAQLRDIADRLKRPTATFFLPEPPPEKGRRQVDFRTLPETSESGMGVALELELRLAELKRQDALDLAEELEVPLPEFTFRASLKDDPEVVGSKLRRWLDVPAPGNRLWRDKYTALKTWREAIERVGVLIMQASGIPVSVMRGCALASFPLPVVIVNGGDAPAGRTFTLLHELGHLALGQDSLCDLVDGTGTRSPLKESIEVFCNHIAGAALVPMDALLSSRTVVEGLRRNAEGEWDDSSLIELSRQFGTSSEVVLRRLVIGRAASPDFYGHWRAQQQRAMEGASSDDGGFVEYFRRVVNHNGRVFTRLVVDAYQRELITGTELSRMLGTKLLHLPKIQAEVGMPETLR